MRQIFLADDLPFGFEISSILADRGSDKVLSEIISSPIHAPTSCSSV